MLGKVQLNRKDQNENFAASALVAVAVAASLTACISSTRGGGSSVQTPHTWAPSANFTQKLSVKITSQRTPPAFEMSVAADYKYASDQHPNRKLYLFRGPARADGTSTAFMLATYPRTTGRKQPATLSESMNLALDGIKSGRSQGFKSTPLEEGTINGLPFMRSYWSGQEPTRKQNMRGFVYGTVYGDEFIQIAAQDFDQYQASTLPLLEAATQTFKLVAGPRQ